MFCQFEYNKPTFVDNNLLGPPLYLAIFVVNVSPFIYEAERHGPAPPSKIDQNIELIN